MFTPLITAISKLYKTKVDLLVIPTWEGSSSILKNDEFVYEIFGDKNPKFTYKYDLMIETWWGVNNVKISFDCKKVITAKQPNYFNQHEIEYNMDLARELGWEGETPKQWVNHNKLPKLKLKVNSRIGIHSGCFGGVWKKKKYPHFYELISELAKDNLILNFGSEKEKIVNNDGLLGDLFVEYAGNLDLQGTIDLMTSCDYFISNDSGLMHIADALNIPLIALFGPTLITKNRPINENSNVLVNTMTCQPCQYTEDFNRCQDNKCLQFKPEMIINYMKKLNWISD